MMQSILYTSAFVPPEWIAAHGLLPQRIIPMAAQESSVMGVCPFAHAYREAVQNSSAAGAIFALTCDQMRRAPDSLSFTSMPVFELNVPATWQQDSALAYYADELQRLSSFLVACGGEVPTEHPLIATLRRYDVARKQFRDDSRNLRGYARAEAMLALHADPQRITAFDDGKVSQKAIPLALVAGDLVQESLGLYAMIEDAGGRVALDATAHGERGHPVSFDAVALQQTPFEAMAAAYFLHIKAAFRRPNHRLYSWLDERLATTKCRGIVFHSYTGCDLWHAEAERLRQHTALPVLTLLQSAPEFPNAHVLNRIEAFMEAL